MSRGAFLPRAFLPLAAGLGACRSIPVTPAAIEASSAASEEKERAIRAWHEAVALANEFLASPFRRTLPAARYDLGPDGMRFVSADRSWPIEVRSTTWGDLVLWAGFHAQEREYGFCVGDCPPEKEPLLDNSFFRTSDGGLLEPGSIADLILHETAHVIAREGTIGFWNSLAFYAEAVLLFRSTTHSDEDIPHAVSEEFAFFRFWPGGTDEQRALALSVLEKHLGEKHPHCRHGVIEGIPPSAPATSPRRYGFGSESGNLATTARANASKSSRRPREGGARGGTARGGGGSARRGRFAHRGRRPVPARGASPSRGGSTRLLRSTTHPLPSRPDTLEEAGTSMGGGLSPIYARGLGREEFEWFDPVNSSPTPSGARGGIPRGGSRPSRRGG
ncbi:MAG: hypothetical protein ACREIU_03005, partial [Planctomycetota bacterium]